MSLTQQILNCAAIAGMQVFLFGLACAGLGVMVTALQALARAWRKRFGRFQHVPGSVERCEQIRVLTDANHGIRGDGYVYLIRYRLHNVLYRVQQFFPGYQLDSYNLLPTQQNVELKVPVGQPERGRIVHPRDDLPFIALGNLLLFTVAGLGMYGMARLNAWMSSPEEFVWAKDAGDSLFGAIVFLPLGLWALFCLCRAAREYLPELWRSRVKGQVVDYYIFAPDVENTLEHDERPYLIITAETNWRGSVQRFTLPKSKVEDLFGNVGLNPYAPSFWYSKQEWDQCLPGRDIDMAIGRLSGEAVLASEAAAKRRALAAFAMLTIWHAALLVVFML